MIPSLAAFGRQMTAIKRLIIVAACLLAVGCGAIVQVAYNNSGFALRMMADDYFDLNDEQERYLEQPLADFHDWHRREELPIYARMFAGAAERIRRGLMPEDVTWAFGEVRERYRVLTLRAIEETAPLLAKLEAENLKALEAKLAENNAKFAKEYPLDKPEKQDRARTRRLEAGLRHFLGDLTEEQHALATRFVQSQPRMTLARLDYRRQRQREIIELLQQYRSASDLVPRLRNYFLGWQRDPESERARETREWEDRFAAFILDLDRSLTAQQRRHAVQKFTSYADDCRVLARQGPSARERAELETDR